MGCCPLHPYIAPKLECKNPKTVLAQAPSLSVHLKLTHQIGSDRFK